MMREESLTGPARSLLEDMIAYVNRLPKGEEKVLAPQYAKRIDAVGKVEFLVEVFRMFADSELTTWMLRLGYCWKDLSFEGWMGVLRQISSEPPALYQFVWFACEALAVDITAMMRLDSGISEEARALVAHWFPNGGPLPDSEWFHEMLEEHGIDDQAMWRRLSAEGAPMRFPEQHSLPGAVS